MPDPRHIDILWQGVERWNYWRERNPAITPDLSGTTLMKKDLSGANLNGVKLMGARLNNSHLMNARLIRADLTEAVLDRANLEGSDLRTAILYKTHLSAARLMGAQLTGAQLIKADLKQAWLAKADLSQVDLSYALLHEANLDDATLTQARLARTQLPQAHLRRAQLMMADLSESNLDDADVSGANLSRANLNYTSCRHTRFIGATLIGTTFTYTDLTGANLSQCKIFGSSVWNIQAEGAVQNDLLITNEGEPGITVDNLEVAQFIYLILNNQKIRDVIDTITSKVVLILGNFSDDRKPVLDVLRKELRQHNLSPVMFDFPPSPKRNLTETISLLASLSRFVIADLTDPRSLPQELERIIPHNPSTPVQPLLQIGAQEYALFESFQQYHWVLPIYRYSSTQQLVESLKSEILPGLEKWFEKKSQHEK